MLMAIAIGIDEDGLVARKELPTSFFVAGGGRIAIVETLREMQ